MSYYRVTEYVNVTQNDEGQWVVIDKQLTDVIIKLDKDTEPRDVCKTLKSEGILSSSDMRKLLITSFDSDIIEIKEKKTGSPICRLEKTVLHQK